MTEELLSTDMNVCDVVEMSAQSYDELKKAYYEKLRTNFEIYEVGQLLSEKLSVDNGSTKINPNNTDDMVL